MACRLRDFYQRNGAGSTQSRAFWGLEPKPNFRVGSGFYFLAKNEKQLLLSFYKR